MRDRSDCFVFVEFAVADPRHAKATNLNEGAADGPQQIVLLGGADERICSLALGDGWQGDKTLDVIVKFTPAKPEVLKKARPHALDANLEMDASVLDSMQKFNAELGYLKYKELQPVGKLFNFAYRDRAVQELGRK